MEIYVHIIMVSKKALDIVDKLIQHVNWKIGNFDMLPIVFGTMMALIDIVMMGVVKMTSTGQLATAVGLPLAMGLYALEPIVFLKAMSYQGMVITNLVWNMMSNIIVTLQGVFIFGESIKGLRWVGIGMSIVALSIFAYTND
jgi:multidrug transporter EmrE-like cation transporter